MAKWYLPAEGSRDLALAHCVERVNKGMTKWIK